MCSNQGEKVLGRLLDVSSRFFFHLISVSACFGFFLVDSDGVLFFYLRAPVRARASSKWFSKFRQSCLLHLQVKFLFEIGFGVIFM